MIKLTVYEFGEALVTKYTDRELHKEILGMSEEEYKEYLSETDQETQDILIHDAAHEHSIEHLNKLCEKYDLDCQVYFLTFKERIKKIFGKR